MKAIFILLFCICIIWFAAAVKKNALIIVDVQKCFVTGSLAVPGAADIVPIINELRKIKFDKIYVTKDWHPANHVSFASAHPNIQLKKIKLKYNNDMKLCKDASTGTTADYTFECTTEEPKFELEQDLWPDHCVSTTDDVGLATGLLTKDGDIIVKKGDKANIDSYSGLFDNTRAMDNNGKYTSTDLPNSLKTEGIQQVFVVGLAFDYCVKSTAIDAKSLPFIEEVYIVKDATKSVVSQNDQTVISQLNNAAVRVITKDKVASLLDPKVKIIVEVPAEDTTNGQDNDSLVKGLVSPTANKDDTDSVTKTSEHRFSVRKSKRHHRKH